MTVALKALRSLLSRLEIEFSVPFRDFRAFRTYWINHDMANSWAARREFLSSIFEPVRDQLEQLEEDAYLGTGFRGPLGEMRNIIP
ncbi:hypothetical protein [Kitasatospora mediocidica]|uniref:hypothetical protein n=1 Tax=Kitasatospora mediocidica TaxID=58352 RepID=UPI00055F38C7|nr:hypothetical protein [Kitasatospora mediocidica]